MPKRIRLFRRLLISYLAILVIPSLAGYLSYRASIAATESVSIENSISQLQKSQSILERRMAEVEGFTRQLALNPELNALMNEKPSDKLNVYGIWSLMREVTAISQTNDFLQNFFIYLTNYNAIIMPGTTYYRPDHYFDTEHYANLSEAQWERKVLHTTHRSEILPLSPFVERGEETSVVTYMQSFPLDSFTGSSPATAVIIIDESTITSLLSSLQERYGGWVHVSDENGRAIGSLGIDEQEIERLQSDASFDKGKQSQLYGDDLVISIRSQTNGWVYMAGIPKQVLLENANHIKHITWTVTGAALLIGLLAGLVLSYRNSAPINRLLGLLREQFGSGVAGRSEYDFLQGNISAMLSTNKRLEEELVRQQPVVRDALLKRLLAGEFQSREEIAAAAEQANIGLPERGYAAIIQINGYSGMDSVQILNELSAARILLRRELIGLDGTALLTDMGSDRIAALIGDGREAAETAGASAAEALLERLSALAFDEYRMTITAAVGEAFSTVAEVPRSYDQASQTLEYAFYTNRKGVVRYGDAPTDSTTYYYPLESELRLIGTVRAGDGEEAKRIVRTVFEENASHRKLSAEMKHQLMAELQGTFLKLLDQKVFLESRDFEALKQRIGEIARAETMEEAREETDAIIEALCGVVTSRKNDMHAQMVEQIKRVIAEMYADRELTLYRIAERVERPEKYISQLFKEATGVNLSDYLEKVRLDHAAGMLRSHSLTVDEIAEKVGYNSSHSFRRAFKRVMGVPPSSYRQSIQE